MPIYDQTFRRYTGPRTLKTLWWPVAWFTFKPILKMKLVWLLTVGTVLYIAGMSVLLFAVAKLGEFTREGQSRDAMRTLRREGFKALGADVSVGTVLFTTMQPLMGLLWLLVLAAGAGSISSDRRHNALPLYFSRPLKPWHYTFGKILGIGMMPAAVMVACQWIIGLEFIALYFPFSTLFKEIPTFLAGITYVLVLCGFIATAMASISSMARSSRVAGVIFIIFFVLMQAIVPLLAEGTDSSALLALSPLHSLDVIGRALLRPDLDEIMSSVQTGTLSAELSVLSIGAYAALFLFILRRNLQVVEVVK